MKTIYLVRHGRTRSNEEGRFQGWEDHPLSPVGQEQALSLKKRAHDLTITALYTSDLVRTKETAQPLAEEKHLVPQAHTAFREISFGEWEGCRIADLRKTDQKRLQTLWLTPTQVTLSGAEDLQEAQVRGMKGLNEVKDAMEDGTAIMVVSHGGMIRLLLCSILQSPIDCMWRLTLDNTSVTKLTYDDLMGYRVIYLNQMGLLT